MGGWRVGGWVVGQAGTQLLRPPLHSAVHAAPLHKGSEIPATNPKPLPHPTPPHPPISATHNNLFTNMDAGKGTRPWHSGGDKSRGAQSGANTTWWGIYAAGDGSVLMPLPACTFGPMLNWVGRFKNTVQDGACPNTRWSVDALGAKQRLLPQDIFAAQRKLRGLLPS